MQLNMINSASGDHGDEVLDAAVQPRVGGPAFRSSTVAHPIFADTKVTSDQCAFGSRCPALHAEPDPTNNYSSPDGPGELHLKFDFAR